MAKQLAVSISSSVSEAVKDNALAAVKVSHGAADVIRDANGKVVMVRITLPDSAADAARTALAATPGVSNIGVTDIIPGTKGIDGTSLTGLSDLGFAETYSSVTPSLGSGTVIYTLGSGFSTYTVNNANNPIPFDTAGMSLEMRLKFTSDTGAVSILGNDGGGQFRLDLQDIGATGLAPQQVSLSSWFGSPFVNAHQYSGYANPTFDRTAFHSYKLIVAPGAAGIVGGLTFELDGVAQNFTCSDGVVSGISLNPTWGNGSSTSLQISLQGIGPAAIEVDFIRWTLP